MYKHWKNYNCPSVFELLWKNTPGREGDTQIFYSVGIGLCAAHLCLRRWDFAKIEENWAWNANFQRNYVGLWSWTWDWNGESPKRQIYLSRGFESGTYPYQVWVACPPGAVGGGALNHADFSYGYGLFSLRLAFQCLVQLLTWLWVLEYR